MNALRSNTPALMKSVNDANKWQVFLQDLKDIRSEELLFVEGGVYVIRRASPNDVDVHSSKDAGCKGGVTVEQA